MSSKLAALHQDEFYNLKINFDFSERIEVLTWGLCRAFPVNLEEPLLEDCLDRKSVFPTVPFNHLYKILHE